MTVELRNIPGHQAPQGYSETSIATGTRIVHVAGQVGHGEDLTAQTRSAARNVAAALDAAGASGADLAKLTIHVAAWEPSKYPELGAALSAAYGELGWRPVPVTLLGAGALFQPDHLIEIEAVAVCD